MAGMYETQNSVYTNLTNKNAHLKNESNERTCELLDLRAGICA